MNFIWLNSHPGEGSDLPRHRTDMIALGFEENPARAASEHECAAIVVEVQDPADVQRAVDLIDQLHETCPVWIYQRSATVQSTLCFMKAGASCVMTQPEEIEA